MVIYCKNRLVNWDTEIFDRVSFTSHFNWRDNNNNDNTRIQHMCLRNWDRIEKKKKKTSRSLHLSRFNSVYFVSLYFVSKDTITLAKQYIAISLGVIDYFWTCLNSGFDQKFLPNKPIYLSFLYNPLFLSYSFKDFFFYSYHIIFDIVRWNNN